MKKSSEEMIEKFFARRADLQPARAEVEAAAVALADAFRSGHKLLLCGNGGSSSDCDHIAGELLKGFLSKRPLDRETKAAFAAGYGEYGAHLADSLQRGLPAISLNTHSALVSAFANDVDSEFVYAQQVMAYSSPGDVLIGISTSGNAKNVRAAMATAKLLGLKTIGLSGGNGGKLREDADICVLSPQSETYRVQEDHLAIYHLICMVTEEELFG